MTRARIGRRAGISLLALVLITPSIVWIARDNEVWPWDPSLHGEESIDLWANLRSDPQTWPSAMSRILGFRPPGIVWLGQFFVPLRHVVGSVEDALILSVLLTAAATVGLVTAAVLRLRHDRPAAGFIAALIVAGAPLFVALEHAYWAETMQALSIAWVLFILVSAHRWRFALTASQIVAVVAFSLIVKLTGPLYVALPVVGALLAALRARPLPILRPWWRDTTVVASIIAAAIAGFSAVVWYRFNLKATIDHARHSAEPGLYGDRDAFFTEVQSWIGRVEDATFLPYFGTLTVVLACVAFAVGARPLRLSYSPALVSVVACAGNVALVVAAFSLQGNDDDRFVMPLIPYVAFVVAAAFAAGGVRTVTSAAVALAALHFVAVHAQSHGNRLNDRLTYHRLTAPVHSEFRDVVRDAVRVTCTTRSSGHMTVVGADYAWLNFNYLQMIAAELRPTSGCLYTSLGYAEASVEAAWQRVIALDPKYYIALDYGNPANPLEARYSTAARNVDAFNRVNRAVYARISSSSRFDVVANARRGGLIVFTRR